MDDSDTTIPSDPMGSRRITQRECKGHRAFLEQEINHLDKDMTRIQERSDEQLQAYRDDREKWSTDLRGVTDSVNSRLWGIGAGIAGVGGGVIVLLILQLAKS